MSVWEVIRLTANRCISYLLAALPIATGFLYVHLFGVNVVYNDEWTLAARFYHPPSSFLTISDFWDPHNQNRSFFPYVAIFVLASITKWNTVVEMYLGQVCLLGALIAMFVAFRLSVGPRPLIFVPVAFLVFSLVQYFNMLYGYQLTFVFTETFAVLTFFFLYLSGRRSVKRLVFPAALASATIAAFSAIQGLLVWPAGLLQFFVAPLEKSEKKRLITGWSVFGLGVWIVYFIGYAQKLTNTSVFYPLAHPIIGFEYFLTLLGSSLVPSRLHSLALASGLLVASLIVVSLLVIYRSTEIGEYSFWIALVLFAVLVSMAITAGRSSTQHLPASRYANFPVLAVASVYVILAKSALERRSRVTVAAFGVLLAIILLTLPIAYYKGMKSGNIQEKRREWAAYVLYTYRSQPENCLKLVRKSNTQSLQKFAPAVENLGYNVFSGARPHPPSNLRCPG